MSEDPTPFPRPEGEASTINNGGPAFPVWELNGNGQPEMTGFGMSLRDWFAGQVLGEAFRMVMDLPAGEGRPHPAKWAAAVAYEIADAMLAERAKARGGAA